MSTIEMNTKIEPHRITFDNGNDDWFHMTWCGKAVVADSFGTVELTEQAREQLIEWLSKGAPKAGAKK